MELNREERALVFLSACSGLEPREQAAVLQRAGSAELALAEFEKISAEVIKSARKGVYKEGSLKEREAEIDRYCRRLERIGAFAVTLKSSDYPLQLASIPIPPLVLYGRGNRALLSETMFCIVGSRRTPPWAEKLAGKISGALSQRFAIVTGLAEGGDSAALRGSLGKGRAICVLPCGIDRCYPTFQSSLKEETAERGLILSECALGGNTKRYSFHLRNRILAGLSRGVLVVSAGEKSGALITAGYGVDFGRDVFAFPYNPGVEQGEGCNALIKKGAYLCTGVEDVLECYGLSCKDSAPTALSESEILVLGTLLEGELHVSVMAERAGMQVHEVLATLASLELKGLAVKTGANRYCALKP